jgi:hypothetical protein
MGSSGAIARTKGVLAPGRLRKPVRVAMVAALVLAFLATDARATTRSNAGVRGLILFAGDSNETLAAAQIDWALTGTPTTGNTPHKDNGYVVMMSSRVGASVRTPDCVSETQPCATNDYWKLKFEAIFAKAKPDAIVTNLGINDTLDPGTDTGPGYSHFKRKVDWFMQLVPSTTTVFWSNLPCKVEPESRRPGCLQVNWALAVSRVGWPNLVLLDWNPIANVHPEWIDPTSGVHFTEAGQAAWVAMVVDALDTHFHPL